MCLTVALLGVKKSAEAKSLPDPSNHQVIILTGEFAGEEGFCLGPTHSGLWAVTPNSSAIVLDLKFDEDFGILINKGQAPGKN